MNFWEALFIGLIQGLTEFLPVSSTAHIILAREWLGIDTPGLFLEIWLHLASLLAVGLYFRKDLWDLAAGGWLWIRSRGTEGREAVFWILCLGIATVLTGAVGILLKDAVGVRLTSLPFMGSMLILTGCFLILIERVRFHENRQTRLSLRVAILVGLAQAVAVLPGLSRSGTTLMAALGCGLPRETAVRFSFLLALPVIAGSSLIGLSDMFSVDVPWGGLTAGALVISFVASGLASWLGIVWLIGFLRSRKLYWFAIYCLCLGGLLILNPF